MVDGIYYDLSVDYATQIWDEFVKSNRNTNDEETTDFSVYHFLKTVKDNLDVFPTIARIPDAML